MTNEEIRIKVAEAMGWTDIRGETGYPSAVAELAGNYYTLPNYPQDLNACAEFEATLTEDEQAEYWKHLVTLCNEAARERNNFRLVGVFYQITAKPKQRCLAYLKTKGILP